MSKTPADSVGKGKTDELYRAMFRNNLAVKLLIDPDTAALVDVNQAACDFYGYSREEFLRKNITEINPLSREEILQEMQAAKSEERKYFRFQHRLANGELRDVEIYSGPVVVDDHVYLHSIVHDITERKLAEEQLRRSELYFRSLIEQASDIITICRADGTITYESPSVERILGIKPDELVGQPVTELVHPDDVKRTAASFADLAKRPGATTAIITRVLKASGDYCTLDATGRNLLDDPVVGGIVINSRDVTERVEAEQELLRRTEELERLNRFMVDRELRMVELKKEVRTLKRKIARFEPAYGGLKPTDEGEG